MIVDLRSDTVTRPSAGMRRAMMEAELGDDPTVNRLQERAAEIFGFESALLFPSGTQSNLAALPHTNVVMVKLPPDSVSGLTEHLKNDGILVLAGSSMRLVTHLDVDSAGIDRAIAAFRGFFGR